MKTSTPRIVLLLLIVFMICVFVVWCCLSTYYPQSSYYLVAAGVFKNEAHILDEWVCHYRLHGIEHLYLINDGSTDNFKEVLAPHIQSGYVTLLHQTEKIDTYPRQKRVYERLLRPYLSTSKWWAILDLDEFLYDPTRIDVKQAIREMENADQNISQITVPWVMFGSSGHIDQPRLVVPNFLWRKRQVGDNVKSIFRSDFLKEFDVHIHKMKRGDTKACNTLLLNHYVIQSWKFFERVKMTRGDCDRYAQQVGVVRDRAYFDKYDYHDETDDRLARQNTTLSNRS